MRNISFSLTTPMFLDGSKDVTRRLGWLTAKKDEVLCAVEKAQGLKKGEKVKPIGTVLVVSARRECLDQMLQDEAYGREECRREGFPRMTPEEFVAFFRKSHGNIDPWQEVTRIEFKKLPLVKIQFAMHLRMSHGSTMGHNLLAEDGTKIGAMSAFVPKLRHADKHPARTIYTLFGSDPEEFETAESLLLAYQAQIDKTKEKNR
jgi:hypothetical protein